MNEQWMGANWGTTLVYKLDNLNIHTGQQLQTHDDVNQTWHDITMTTTTINPQTQQQMKDEWTKKGMKQMDTKQNKSNSVCNWRPNKKDQVRT